MFEHKHLDGDANRIIPAAEAFLTSEVLERREGLIKDTNALNRMQYGVVGDLLVERSLPPETVGDTWSHDNAGTPWWTKVMNPPHMGIIAEFNLYSGGLHRKALDPAHNVVAYAGEGEEVVLTSGTYSVTRKSDGQELTATNLVELRKLYYA